MKVTLDVEVDPVFHATLLAGALPIGQWARTMASHPALGRLLREHDGAHADGEAALRAWAAGAVLPKGWHRLDEEVVRRAWAAGVRRWGERWYAEGDAARVNAVVQEALLGEVVHG